MKKFLSVIALMSAFTATDALAAVVSWYGPGFHGRKTASGERFNQNAMSCASNSHKFGTKLKVTNLKNNKSVICKVNDTGGFSKHGVTLDLSKAAFQQIASSSVGVINIKYNVIE